MSTVESVQSLADHRLKRKVLSRTTGVSRSNTRGPWVHRIVLLTDVCLDCRFGQYFLPASIARRMPARSRRRNAARTASLSIRNAGVGRVLKRHSRSQATPSAICWYRRASFDAGHQDPRREELMRGLFVATSMVLCGQCVFAQDAALMKSISRELKVLESFTGADEETLGRIQSTLEPVVEQVQRNSSGIEFVLGFVPPAIYDGLAVSARRELGGAPKLADYLTDLQARREFKQRATAAMFLLQLDRAVELRRKQWKDAKRVVNELASRAALPSTFAIEVPKLSSEAKSKLKIFLTEQQFEFLEKNYAAVRVTSFSASTFRGDIDERRKKLKVKLTNVAAARTAWLTDEFKLNEAQSRKLQLAAKGAISKLIDGRMEAEDKFAQMLQEGIPKFMSKDAQLAMADASTLLTRFSRWRKLVDSVLNDEQEAALKQMNLKRAALERKSYASMGLLSLCRELTINAKQLQGFADVLEEITPPVDPTEIGNPYAGMGRLAELDPERMKKVIGTENWALLKPQLDMMKLTMGEEEEEE